MTPAGPVYLDASALVKLYFLEAESALVNAMAHGRSDLFISDLGITEVTSALARRGRESGQLRAAPQFWESMLTQVRLGVLSVLELVPSVHRDAERLLLRPDHKPLRAADGLHLALARSGGAATLACYDSRLRAAASTLGLGLFPPG